MRVKLESQRVKGAIARYSTSKTGDIWQTAVRRWPVLALAELKSKGLKIEPSHLERVSAKTEGKQELRTQEFADYVDHVVRADSKN